MNIPYNKTKVIAILILIIVLVAAISFKLKSTPQPQIDKVAQLSSELNQLVSNTNSKIKNTISAATKNKEIAEQKIIVDNECIRVNTLRIEHNNKITVSDFIKWISLQESIGCNEIKLSTWTATGAINPVPSWLLAPNQLYLTAKLTDQCKPSLSPKQHYELNRRHAWDIICTFGWNKIWQFQLYAPDYKNEVQIYKVTNVYKSTDTGNTIDLTFWNKRWTIGHVQTKLKKWDTIKTGQLIGQTDLSWTTTWYHSHIELWIDWYNVAYDSYSTKLDNYRKTSKPTVQYWWGQTYYFTAYNLGDVNQNDASPCIWASWNDLCKMESIWIKTIALTADVRNSLWLKFWDKIKLEWPCWWMYQVEDDMNCRFRWKPCRYKQNWKRYWHPTGNTLRPWTNYYIKWDIPSCWWGAHKILPA